ncbi:MAG: hypothetical protein K9K32_05455 [Halanaerobiales bacterium]|nr:hypothetical protein [Halanaerobiales bacterium]
MFIKINKGSKPLKDGITLYDKNLYYGDYWGNKYRIPVFIYKVNLEKFEKELFFVFKKIRHIHFVQHDKYNPGYLLVGTGDKDTECGIYKINIKNKKTKTIGEGSQQFRAVSIIQAKKYLFWGSDNPNGKNYIYIYDKTKRNVRPVKEIEGPAYYSTVDKNGYYYIATTIENRKKHKAIIYKSQDDGCTWQEFKKFKKDFWHCKYFGYGFIEFFKEENKYEKLSYKLHGLKRE